jgi:hypothetical protein
MESEHTGDFISNEMDLYEKKRQVNSTASSFLAPLLEMSSQSPSRVVQNSDDEIPASTSVAISMESYEKGCVIENCVFTTNCNHKPSVALEAVSPSPNTNIAENNGTFEATARARRAYNSTSSIYCTSTLDNPNLHQVLFGLGAVINRRFLKIIFANHSFHIFFRNLIW